MLKNLQSLRALAAYLVVLLHCAPLLAPIGVEADALKFGNAGVHLFFVISGFIMVHTTGPDTGAAEFLKKRVTKVAPLYWLVTIFVFGLAVAAPSLFEATRADPVELLKSLLFIPFEKSNGMMMPVVFVGWTLNYEMLFYLLFACGLIAGRLGVWLVAAALAGLAALHPLTGGGVAGFYTDPIVLEFAGGMMLGLAYRRFAHWRIGLPALALLVAGAALLVAAQAFWPQLPLAIAYGGPSMLIVGGALLAEKRGQVLRAPLIQTLGAASYSIYLSHFFITDAAEKVLGLTRASPLIAGVLVVGAFVGAGVGGVIVWRLVEDPATRLSRRLLLGPRAAPVAAATGQAALGGGPKR